MKKNQFNNKDFDNLQIDFNSDSFKQKVFNKFELSWYTKNSLKGFLRKVGTSFGFVIILMPIFGITLSIGYILDTYKVSSTAVNVFKSIGSVLFANIGIWFALSICIGFTNNKGVSVYSSIIFYIVFNIAISAFVKNNNDIFFDILFWKNLESKIYLSNSFGVKTFNTGVIGGIFCGSITALIYNKFKDVKLIKGLEFFSKEKFVLIIVPFFAFIGSILFMMIWPIMGYSLKYIGSLVDKSPIGLDSFIFRTIQRILIPFGSGLLWQAPMWYTDLGGNLSNYQGQLFAEYLLRKNFVDSASEIYQFLSNSKSMVWSNLSNIVNNFDSGKYNNIFEDWIKNTNLEKLWDLKGDQVISVGVMNSEYITAQDCWNCGIRVTRFLTGGFVNSIFALPTIGIVIYLRIEKIERTKYLGSFVTAILTSFLLGITEPIEFMFCYICPFFFFAIYAPLVGFMGLTTSLLNVKIGTTFSTGLFDFVFNGIIPTINGQKTNIWMLPIIGIVFITITFLITWFYFKKIKFDPLEKAVEKKVYIKNTVLEIKNFFISTKNINNIYNNENCIEVTTNKLLTNNEFDKFFDCVEVLGNKKYKYKIKNNLKESFQIFINAYDANKFINYLKLNYKVEYKKIKKEYIKKIKSKK
ncbi:PTS system, glucose-specific IIBC component [Spiroplasma helicoides]|uniref:PTS system, glucose-specific IIBC component n=1 Tax=Spiroplasma helicoides TaxID=216938 RepID=A0A1B3SKT9_9MOLU|nr:PTS transporter subunit EIIC [Spiroplasma helicoides]AOG60552.1 PTS system, glucose-specific IIBC component [Spiroplasma helicoides]